MSADPARLYDLIRFIRPLYRNLGRAVEKNLADTPISVGMRAILEIVYEAGPVSVPKIADIMGTGRQYVQRMVNDNLAAGTLEKRANPAHRRSVLLALTESGRTAFEAIRAREAANLAAVAAGIDAADLEICLKVVDALHRGFLDEEQPADNELPPAYKDDCEGR
ncbi:MarR family winged helix-turn-helix transcriptional regulator [Acanthopleuribacter pedis]|uniref:MarR family transcriptional regulator n=1 Tax=Acanthopleuribacter pedis TaxID=442870 RepID=A0A8J7QJ69_9BACT|nr:MarR family transcriptional regulator [Acanthopleuribacter pedis]MBO1321776.1 MarR family transcriptional regulator [Acanthopleuribacter pedis]